MGPADQEMPWTDPLVAPTEEYAPGRDAAEAQVEYAPTDSAGAQAENAPTDSADAQAEYVPTDSADAQAEYVPTDAADAQAEQYSSASAKAAAAGASPAQIGAAVARLRAVGERLARWTGDDLAKLAEEVALEIDAIEASVGATAVWPVLVMLRDMLRRGAAERATVESLRRVLEEAGRRIAECVARLEPLMAGEARRGEFWRMRPR
jgi:hypothetical protein